MAGFAWFQDGSSYGGSDLASFNALVGPRQGFLHLFASAGEFLLSSDQTNRAVVVGAGNVLIGHPSAGATWAWSPGATLAVGTASNDNPRRDLIVARLAVAGTDGTNGVAVELIPGTPSATPAAPARPDNAVALGWVDVPRATTTISATPTRHTGQYRDQGVMSAPGAVAVDWAGQLPSASAARVGAVVYDMGTNQRWVRKADATWFTADPGPWRTVTLQNFQTSDGTSVTTSGTLYIRESSTKWELSGRLDFTPVRTVGGLAIVGTAPTTITRPTIHTYGTSGQTFAPATGGAARIALTTTGTVELGAVGALATLYCNVQLSKSPHNTAV